MARFGVGLMIATVLSGCGGETDTAASSHPKTSTALDARLDTASVVFCFCRHGCGPGLDGYFKVIATNAGEASIVADVDGLWLRGATTLHLTRDGQGLLYNASPFTLAAHAEQSLTLTLQPDTDATFPAGAYDLELDFEVDKVPVAKPLGSVLIPFVPNDYCGTP